MIEAAHKRSLKVTGHLCSITYREAAELGIDNIEHGFVLATEFNSEKKPDICPPATEQSRTAFLALTPDSPGSRPDPDIDTASCCHHLDSTSHGSVLLRSPTTATACS